MHHADGRLAREAGALAAGEPVTLKFRDGERAAVIDGAPGPAVPGPSAGQAPAQSPSQGASRAAAKPRPGASAGAGQGDLF